MSHTVPLKRNKHMKIQKSIWASLKNKMGLLTTNKNEKSLGLKIKIHKDKRKNVGDGILESNKEANKVSSSGLYFNKHSQGYYPIGPKWSVT
jgi:hypothetical protein